jgi:hypothetical protein
LADFFAAPGAATFVGFFAAFAAGFGAADFEAAAFLAGAFLVAALSAVFATGNSLHWILNVQRIPLRTRWRGCLTSHVLLV